MRCAYSVTGGNSRPWLLPPCASRSTAMASDFSCSICLELFKVPVSLSCGHSFCKSCIESHWAVQSAKARFTCPECREIYYQKPKLSKNILLANIVADLNKINIVPRPGRRCKRHGQGLDLYCKTDTQLICMGCMGDHRRHDIVPVQAQRGEKAGQLSSMMQQLSMREETETSIVSGPVDSTKTVEDKASALRAIDKERDLKLLEIRQEIEKNQATLRSLTEVLSRIRSLEETEDPVEFLESCIESHWAVQSAKARLTCPECREIYYQKPKLSKNILLANIVADLNQINIVPRPGRRCKRHGQGLGLYCKTDTQLICVGCMGDHRRHDIVPVKAQRGEKAGQLSSMMQQLSMREETETSIVSGLVDSTKTVEAAAEQTKGMLSGSYDELLRLISEDKASALRAIDKERDLKLLEIRQEIEKNQATLCSLTEALSRIRSLEETEDPVEFLEGCTLHWASFASLGCQRTEPRRPSSPLGFEEAAVPLQKRIDELLRSFKASACAPGGTLALHRSPKTPRGGGGGTGASEAAAAVAATPAPRGIEAAGTSGGPAVAPSGLNRAFLIRSCEWRFM
ncbi:unnamed protein product [Lampetra fluviatilis]